MLLRQLQGQVVDAVKRHALAMAVDSPRAHIEVLREYLWSEEGAESVALGRIADDAPPWLAKLLANQLDDERRHAALLRDRLGELGASDDRPAPSLLRAKLWWIDRACAPYRTAFVAGPMVIVCAVAAQLETTGARVLARHLAVLEQRAPADRTAAVLRSILADERRHARSCDAAARRLLASDRERAEFDTLRARIAGIDRAFGVTIAIGYWLRMVTLTVRDGGRW